LRILLDLRWNRKPNFTFSDSSHKTGNFEADPGGAGKDDTLKEALGIFGVPCGSRTSVAAVKEKRPMVIQWNLAAWIALYRS